MRQHESGQLTSYSVAAHHWLPTSQATRGAGEQFRCHREVLDGYFEATAESEPPAEQKSTARELVVVRGTGPARERQREYQRTT